MINSVKNYLNQIPFSPAWIGVVFGLLSFLLRIPYLFRYDLHYGGDPAIGYLMELRILQGNRPFYFYAQNYMGALEPYFGAILMKLFGPSIPLAGAVGLFQWSIAVGIFIFLFTSSTSKFEGFLAGIFSTIGVPYTLTYMTQPFTGNASNVFITSVIVLASVSILSKGGALFRFATLGFLMGLGLFLNPQSMISSAASLLSLCLLKTPNWNPRFAFRPWVFGTFITGLLMGDTPDIWYKFHHGQTNNFLKIASPYYIMRNIECAGKCVLAYFDAHPISRISDGIYFWLKIYDQTRPDGLFDDLFLILALSVLILIGFSFHESLQKKNHTLFLFSSLVLINLLAIIISAKTNADTLNTRRYLTASAIPFSIWTSFLFTKGLEKKSKTIQILTLCLISLFVGRITVHYIQLLRTPDQLREMRWALDEMKKAGLNRGLSDWPFSDILTSLTNQQIIVAQWPGSGKIRAYENEVATSDRIAIIETNEENTETVVDFAGSKFLLDGKILKNDTFWMAPYRLIK